jgi:hypothetical protein
MLVEMPVSMAKVLKDLIFNTVLCDILSATKTSYLSKLASEQLKIEYSDN